MKVVIEGYELRYVRTGDIILPEDYNNKVNVLKVFMEKIDKIIGKLEEYWEKA